MGAEQNIGWAGTRGLTAGVAEPSSATPKTRVALTAERLRAWGWLSALSLLDQGLTSGAGFGVNLLLARWMAPNVYGAFAVAFAGFLFVSGFHNVLLLEPLSVMGPSRYAGNLAAYFRAQFCVHVVLVGALSGALLLGGLVLWRVVPGNPLVGAVTGGGLALPLLLLAWLARRMCYVLQRPSAAVLGSGLYLSLAGAGLFVLAHYGWLGPFTAFLLMGCGSAVSSIVLFWRLDLAADKSSPGAPLHWMATLQENWNYGKWLVGSALLNPAVTLGQVFLIAAFLGLGAAGVLRAMQQPSLVMTQAAAAIGLLFLPVLSADYGRKAIERMRHKAMLLSLALAGVSLCFAGLLTLASGPLEQMLFGGKYAGYAWLIPVLAVVPVVNSFSIGYSIALRAAQKPQFDLLANLVAAPVALLSALVGIRWWGIAGAACSMVTSVAAYSCVYWFCYRRLFRRRTSETQ